MLKIVTWNNHKILGSLSLNLCKSDGMPYDTVVIAGENGTGKTTILETIATFLDRGSIAPFSHILYEVDGADYKVEPAEKYSDLGFHTRTNLLTGEQTAIRSNRNSDPSSIESDLNDMRHYGVCYTKARSGFATKPVSSTTTQQLDADKYEVDSSDDFTQIKQLIVDVLARDNSDWMRITESKEGTPFEEFKLRSRKYRFEAAFNGFFESLQFIGINDWSNNELEIVFEKQGALIPIDCLSTGEKQIVYRGAYLLKNIKALEGGVALIDEPELSLHPKWQDRVLDYYRNLFSHDGHQAAQIIISTHSEHIVRSALQSPDDILVIALIKENSKLGVHPVTAPKALSAITAAETNYIAFGIYSVDYHIELYGRLQQKINAGSVMDCDNFIKQQTSFYDPKKHQKPMSFSPKPSVSYNYETLPTYIRNAIDHPDSGLSYTQAELECSTELLIKLCMQP